MAFAFGDDVWPGIAKLAEECGEVVQVIGKLMMTHGDRAHWSGDLRTMLIEEMADVQASISFVTRYALTEEEGNALYLRAAQKLVKFEGWHADMDADPPPPLRSTASTGEAIARIDDKGEVK